MRRSAVGGGLAMVLLAGSLSAAAAADVPLEIRAADADARLPESAGDDRPLLNLIARVLSHDLKLRLPEVVLYSAYTGEREYTDAIVRAGAELKIALDDGRGTLALALNRRIIARRDQLSTRSTAERASVYGHELAHVAQHRMGVGDKHVPAWMVEGHAEWAGRRVVEILGLGSYAEGRDRELHRQRAASARRRALLSELHTYEAWRRAREKGWAVSYGQAFLAVDWLVDRYGEDSVRSFLRVYSRMANRPGGDTQEPSNWSIAFPIAYGEFVTTFQQYLNADP